MMTLWKTVIVIWTEHDTSATELTALAAAATDGDAYCSKSDCRRVEDPANDPEWDGTEFFGG